MAVLNPGHLLDQASRLIRPPPAGPPLQVDVRRAISSAYYSVFHFTVTALADQFVGSTYRASSRYVHVYRSLDHARLVTVCKHARVLRPHAAAHADLAAHAFEREMRDFAEWAINLQQARHSCDYDPARLFRTDDAQSMIAMAREAMRAFDQAREDDRLALLTLLLCRGRP